MATSDGERTDLSQEGAAPILERVRQARSTTSAEAGSRLRLMEIMRPKHFDPARIEIGQKAVAPGNNKRRDPKRSAHA